MASSFNASAWHHPATLTGCWPAMGALVEQMALVAGVASLREVRLCFEREYIAAVLEQHGGRVNDTAAALGVRRTNLYRKMRSLNIPRRPLAERR